MAFETGQMLSHYRVVGTLGVGGMGEVYRARDTRLEREVAIKVLPEGWEDDPAHARRFEREARTLAALNHPNVAQVYGLDEMGGTRLLVLELVEGEDLTERIARGPLPVEEAVDVCRQVAEGLETAHELGVIHRDLKPGNVRITAEGVAKVLDFGLAKSVRADAGAERATPGQPPSFQSEAGLLVGTPTYMSPESVRGRPVDRRADIWAFGCVLYECLTGRSPFMADSLPDMLASIVEREPDLSRLPRATPNAVRALIARCLDKDPRTRLRDIGEARIVLSGDLAKAPAPSPVRSRRGIPFAAAIPLALLLVLATWAAFGRRDAVPDRWATARFSTVVALDGTQSEAAISRDGKFLAFVSDHGGSTDVWLTQFGTGALENLTRGRKERWGPRVRNVGFDPEGSHVWLYGGRDHQMKTIPILGEEMRALLDPGIVNVDWSRDGSRLVYQVAAPGDPVYVADADGGKARKLLTHEEMLHQHFPTWSFDGEWIYLVRGRPSTRELNLWRVRADDGNEREQLTFDKWDVAFPTALDADTVLYVARAKDGTGPWLWELDLESKASRRISAGVGEYLSVAADKGGRKIVAAVANPLSYLWTVPIPTSGEAEEADAEPMKALENIRAQTPRFGGGRLYFFSKTGGVDVLCCLENGKRVEVLRGENAPLLHSPAVSPDGAELAIALHREGMLRLHVLSASGGVPRAISGEVAVIGSATWSPDGSEIAIGGEDADGPGLFVFPREGGPYRRIADDAALNPVWSPKGDLVLYCGKQVGFARPVRGAHPVSGAVTEYPGVLLIREGERVRFLPDGDAFVYMEGVRSGKDFWRFDLKTGEKRRLATLDDRAEMRAFDIDPTGRYIVFDRLQKNADIALIELE